ncbi:hypothetical protein HY623_04010 [Candidatus Uhrbacteria bacterium]|nr:hypothetical protein [Candidatus Uhrbacteria bacterium]
MPTLTDTQVLEANIITALNLQGLSDDKKAQLLQKVATMVQKAVQLRILKLLSADNLQKFQEIVTEKGEESAEAIDFIKTNIPNLAKLYEEEVVSAKRMLFAQVGGVTI